MKIALIAPGNLAIGPVRAYSWDGTHFSLASAHSRHGGNASFRERLLITWSVATVMILKRHASEKKKKTTRPARFHVWIRIYHERPSPIYVTKFADVGCTELVRR